MDRTPKLSPRVDWDPRFDASRDVFAPLRAAAARFEGFAEWPEPEVWNETLGASFDTLSGGGARVRFVRQPPRARPRRQRRGREPIDLAGVYDERIFVTGEVPSRARSWHDFFNMLVWATFPGAKRAINGRQRSALRAHVPEGISRLPGARTREQDALSMLDEGGLILLCAPSAHAACRTALGDGDGAALRALVAAGSVRALVFGHAIYEHLVSSEAPVRAAGVALRVPEPWPLDERELVPTADRLLAHELADPARFLSPPREPAVALDPALFASSTAQHA